MGTNHKRNAELLVTDSKFRATVVRANQGNPDFDLRSYVRKHGGTHLYLMLTDSKYRATVARANQ